MWFSSSLSKSCKAPFCRVGRRLRLEGLESRHLLAPLPIISEFMASNNTVLRDEDGDWSDWIEIANLGDEAIDLAGWHLTDNADNLDKWTFPSTVLEPNQQLIVFASGKDRAVSGQPLHTDFQLAQNGEYLALVGPDAQTIATQFEPAYPPQFDDIAYGTVPDVDWTDALSAGADARWWVPADDSLGQTWIDPALDDLAWSSGATPIGYDTTDVLDPAIATDVQAAMYQQGPGLYLRQSFDLIDVDSIGHVQLQTRYDDGFVAYLNGTEVARRNVLLTAPLAYWNFDSAADPFADVSGNGHRVAPAGDAARATATAAAGEGSLRLDGAGDFLNLPDLTTDLVDSATLSLWVKLDVATPTVESQTGFDAFGANAEISHYPWTNGQAYFSTFRNGSRVNYVVPSTDVDRTEWHHLAITTEPGSGTYKIYQDGFLIHQTDPGSFCMSSTATLGKSFGEFYLKGYLDEVYLFDTALSAEEVALLAGRSISTLDLADMVGGGDGTGTGGDRGIVLATGQPTTAHRSNIYGGTVNEYHPSSLTLVDGVFLPDGNVGGTVAVPISSTGLTYTGFADGNGVSWDEIWNGDNIDVSGGPAAATRIGMHASKGITFDLNAVEAEHPGSQAIRFTGLVGSAYSGQFIAYILIDGNLAAAHTLVGNAGASFRVAIPEGARFLTLATLSNGSDVYDWSYFGDPTLVLSSGQTAPSDQLTAASVRPDADVLTPEAIDITQYRDLLVEGPNVLAVHAVNVAADDVDFLIAPAVQIGEDNPAVMTGGYYLTPTPGQPNLGTTAGTGPQIGAVEHSPAQPTATDPLVVTAVVATGVASIDSVQLHYRAMYDEETIVTMHDDGSGDDLTAGDGVYTATIPAGFASAGQMLRYYVETADADGRTNRSPLPLDQIGTKRSPEYFGTVVVDPSLSSQLPILQWFTTDPAGSNTRAGARGSVYYDGRFYDNIFIRQRGAYTVTGSQKFIFNDNVEFYVNETVGFVEEINLNTPGSDQSYVRQTLAFETYQAAGVPACESFLMYMRLNGAFQRVGIFIEQVDENFLQRWGLDPEGALYKLVSSPNPTFDYVTGGMEKKTRLDEDTSDIAAVVAGLNLTDEQARREFLFDTFDMPELINFLAARALTQDIDTTRKNMYLYRDTEGTGLWSIFPWDNDWTFGEVGLWGPVVADQASEQATGNANIIWASHPLIGDSAHPLYQVQYSLLHEVVQSVPETREMLLRRIRTLMDELLQRPDTPTEQLRLEQRVDEIFAPAAPHLGASVAAAVEDLKNLYFPVKRNSLYFAHTQTASGESIELIEPGAAVSYLVPTDNLLGTSWTAVDFDDDAWLAGTTGLGYEDDLPGYSSLIQTEVRSYQSAPEATSIFLRCEFTVDSLTELNELDQFQLEMKYDDGFIAWLNGTEVARSGSVPAGSVGYDTIAESHEASTTTYEAFNLTAWRSLLVEGPNLLAIHALNRRYDTGPGSDMLIVPRLRAASSTTSDPAGIPPEQAADAALAFGTIDVNPASGDQDQEYIQLLNTSSTAIDISGWRLGGGVELTLPPGTVVPAGGAIYLSPDRNAFYQRTETPYGGQGLLVVGNYDGHISNLGETLDLFNADGGLVASISTPFIPSDAQKYLRIVEIMYNPAEPTQDEINAGFTDNDDFEYLELVNTSDSTTLDLTGVVFTQGIDFAFAAGTMLGPGGRILLVRDQAAFAARYDTTGMTIAGEYSEPDGGNKLDNGGETIKLEDALGGTIQEFAYNDGSKWPQEADGEGSSLEAVSLDDGDGDPAAWHDYDSSTMWYASPQWGGSPGAVAAAAVLDRMIFYNGSSFDTGGATGDDAAIADDKIALLPGETAGVENYSSFVDGLSGLMFDVANAISPSQLNADDLLLLVGNTNDPASWTSASTPLVEVRPGAGRGGSDRVVLTWNTIEAVHNAWLQVTVLASSTDTGLLTDDAFYFGHFTGDVGDATSPGWVTTADLVAIRNHPHGPNNPASIDDRYDINRDALVDATDLILARNNVGSPLDALPMIAPPPPDPILSPPPNHTSGEPLLPPETTDRFSLKAASAARLGSNLSDQPLLIDLLLCCPGS